MKSKISIIPLFFLFLIPVVMSAKPAQSLFTKPPFPFDTVSGDELNVREYTLKNGLKVFLAVNKDIPRIQTYIAVRVGSKNDPKNNTGLAHYLEHMMFKGTSHFGTLNWNAEAPLINSIESLYEQHRATDDPAKRAAIYKQIDSISYIASQYAISNEYTKLMSLIGAQGTNASTSYDYTIYQEDIPANRVEEWLAIESDRFKNNVIRLFHTEMEAVYEERNMLLTNDNFSAQETMLNALFPNHPYGSQPLIGKSDHLKNPSIKDIRSFYNQYYVANNMAIVMAGDFDPERTIYLIRTYFEDLKPGNIPQFNLIPEQPITAPVEKTIVGLDAESIRIGFRIQGVGNKENLVAQMMANILYNGKAGLIDLNLNQTQTVLRASCSTIDFVDHGVFMLSGRPKKDQSLDQVKDLLLQQIDLIRKGEFPDWMLEAAINNGKYEFIKYTESNQGIASSIAYTFLEHQPWSKHVNYLDELSKITKQDIIDFANNNFINNYVVVYKKQGTPDLSDKVAKPEITPIHINKNEESDFVKEIRKFKPKPIDPVFIDFSKDIVQQKLNKKIDLLYVKNQENETFELTYYFNMGRFNDKQLPFVMEYLKYLGTKKYTSNEIKEQFYKLACDFRINCSINQTTLTISGLSENMTKALQLMEDLLNNCKVDEAKWNNLVENELLSRKNDKNNQRTIFSALSNYSIYGPINPFTYKLSETELKAIDPKQLITQIQDLKNYTHSILYYGPENIENIVTLINKNHTVSAQKVLPQPYTFTVQTPTANKLFFAHFDAKQSLCQISFKGLDQYTKTLTSEIDLFNNYFGGGSNALVFEELREKRSLAYTCTSLYSTPSKAGDPYIDRSFIATQNDKVETALSVFTELLDSMPHEEARFNLAKGALLESIQTERILGMNIINTYLNSLNFNLNTDIRKEMYEELPALTFDNIVDFNKKYIKNKIKTYVILGNETDFDFGALEKQFGNVAKLSKEDIFGY